MDTRQLASYAYHNCEFNLAIELATVTPVAARPLAAATTTAAGREVSSEEAAAIHVKALTELDAKGLAVSTAETYLSTQPSSGRLLYLLGIARYLAGGARAGAGGIEAAFLASAAAAFAGGAMGLAFLAAADQRYSDALTLLNGVAPEDAELEHARRLSLFQVQTVSNNFAAAEAELIAADAVLMRAPSLLRAYWGQLCWVRLLRAQGRYDAALALAERLLAQLAEETAPRLFRNAREAQRLAAAKTSASHLILPPTQVATPSAAVNAALVSASALATITKKPVLHSLFVYLRGKGQAGATKEDLALHVWEENYNPMIHDDRIYKAVGRLRRIMGDDQQAPKWLTQLGRAYILTLPAAVPIAPGES